MIREIVIQVNLRKIDISHQFETIGVEPMGGRGSRMGSQDHRAATCNCKKHTYSQYRAFHSFHDG